MKIKIYAHGNYLIIDGAPAEEADKDYVPANGTLFGTVLCNCNPANLGISEGAMKLLKGIKKGTDAIGDVDVYQSGAGVVFGYIGGPTRLMLVDDEVEGSREYAPDLLEGKYTPLNDDDAPAEAVKAIKKHTK